MVVRDERVVAKFDRSPPELPRVLSIELADHAVCQPEPISTGHDPRGRNGRSGGRSAVYPRTTASAPARLIRSVVSESAEQLRRVADHVSHDIAGVGKVAHPTVRSARI